MSLTKTDRGSRLIRKFFQKELLPLSDHLRATGKTLFPTKPDPGEATYFKRRDRTMMSPLDFELPGTASPEAFGPALSELWRSTGDAELCVLIPTLTRLARSLYAVGGPEQEQDLSPFIYVMF